VNAAPFVAYSTARPYDIKALSDNIRVRGAPVHTDQYSIYSSVLVQNTVVETDISAAASALGSRTWQRDQPLGSVQIIDLNLAVISGAGDTVTIRYKVNGVLAFTHVIVVPITLSTYINIHSKCQVRAATINCNSTVTMSGVASVIAASAFAYNPALANTWSITAQWGLAASTLIADDLTYETMFRNGA